jgi:hypothetical protein
MSFSIFLHPAKSKLSSRGRSRPQMDLSGAIELEKRRCERERED